MGNIDELLEKVGNKTKLENLNQKNVRSTNIFNLHAILDLKPTLDKTLLDKIKNQIKPQYLEKFTISITDIE